jgi:hypothetical protein
MTTHQEAILEARTAVSELLRILVAASASNCPEKERRLECFMNTQQEAI